MSFCANCGIKLNPSEKFCHECGHHNNEDICPITPSQQSAASTPPVSSPAVSTSTPAFVESIKQLGCLKIGLIAMVSMVILVLLLIAMVFMLTKGPAESADAHFATLKSGSVELAYRQTSGVFQQSTSINNYKQFLAAYPILSDVADTQFLERSVENGQGTLKGSLIDSKGNRVPITIKLIQEQGDWKILAIDLPQGGTSVTPTNDARQPQSAAPATQSQSPVAQAEPSIGKVVFGAGRNADGTLVGIGKPIPLKAPKVSADVELIAHPAGQRVQLWVEHLESGNKSKPLTAEIQGEGNGVFTFDLDAPPQGVWLSGKWHLVILLGEKAEFRKEFETR